MKKIINPVMLISLFLNISCTYERINTLQNVKDTMIIGDNLIENLEKYKIKYGKYPKELNDLVPEFYDKVPKTKMIYFEKNNKRKYLYQSFYYISNNSAYYIAFNADLENPYYQEKSCADSTWCPNISHLSVEQIVKPVDISKNFCIGELRQWDDKNEYLKRNFDDRLEYHFRRQLKYEYVEVQVEEEE